MQENGTEHRRPDPPNRAHRGDVGVILQRKHALATTYHHTERTLSTKEHPVPPNPSWSGQQGTQSSLFWSSLEDFGSCSFAEAHRDRSGYQGRLRFTYKRNSATHVRLGNQTTRFGGASDGHREHARWFRWIATAVLSTREGVILLESPIHLIEPRLRSACGGLRRLWACVALDASRV